MSIVLLSQTGLPVHLHYCKGMLESVSVFMSQGCDDHQEMANLPVCCKKSEASHCDKGDGDCCKDQVNILIQDIDTLVPHFAKWEAVIPAAQLSLVAFNDQTEVAEYTSLTGNISDSGPPIYILHQSLIYYA
jgi:hypothetical protein